MKWVLIGIVCVSGAVVACGPTAMSDRCKQQISACLARCNPEADAPDRQRTTSLQTQNTLTPCESICLRCSDGAGAGPAPVPTTPTGGRRAVPPGAVSAPGGLEIEHHRPDAGAAVPAT